MNSFISLFRKKPDRKVEIDPKVAAMVAKQESPSALSLTNDHDGKRQIKSDMELNEQRIASQVIDEVFSGKLEEYLIPEQIKANLHAKLGGTWSCILGEDFSSYVDHPQGHYYCSFMGNLGVLVFKSTN